MRYGGRVLSEKKRGFAALSPEERKKIAAKGGREAHKRGKAHEFDSESAKKAGSLGGQTVARDRDHMAEIGRLGGKARGKKKGTDE